VATDPTPSRPTSGGSTSGKPSSPSGSPSGPGSATNGPARTGTTTAPPTAPIKPATGGSVPPRGAAASGPSASAPARSTSVRGDGAGVTVDPAERPPVGDTRAGSGAAAATVAQAPTAAARPAGPRRARLLVTRLDPWSVMKTSFMLSVSVGIVLLVATALLWWTLDVTQVFSTIGRTVNDIAGSGTTSFDFLSLVGFSRVMGVALVLVAIEIVLWSALATLFAFLYNLSVGLTGGLEVTLSEDA